MDIMYYIQPVNGINSKREDVLSDKPARPVLPILWVCVVMSRATS